MNRKYSVTDAIHIHMHVRAYICSHVYAHLYTCLCRHARCTATSWHQFSILLNASDTQVTCNLNDQEPNRERATEKIYREVVKAQGAIYRCSEFADLFRSLRRWWRQAFSVPCSSTPSLPGPRSSSLIGSSLSRLSPRRGVGRAPGAAADSGAASPFAAAKAEVDDLPACPRAETGRAGFRLADPAACDPPRAR